MGLQSFPSSAALYTFLFPRGMDTGASFTIRGSEIFYDAYFQPLYAKLFAFMPNNLFPSLPACIQHDFLFFSFLKYKGINTLSSSCDCF